MVLYTCWEVHAMTDNYFIDQDKKKLEEAEIRSNPYYIGIVEQTEENCLLAVSLRFDALRRIPKSLHTRIV